jgi:uncharacterized DUF497 family protein
MIMGDKEQEKTPEWDIFKRIEGIEDIVLDLMVKTDKAEPTLKNIASKADETEKLVMILFATWFNDEIRGLSARDAKKQKDIFVKHFGKVLSKDTLTNLSAAMDALIWLHKQIRKEHRGRKAP